MLEGSLNMVLGAGISFLFLSLMFSPLERAFPARNQDLFRPAWKTDLCFFFGQYLLWGGLVLALLSLAQETITSILPLWLSRGVKQQPFWLQAGEAVLFGDLLIYWVHRFQHSNSVLWRFHSVHHTAEHLDWLAAHREHPVDGLLTQFIINLPAFVLGFPIETLSLLVAFRGLWAIYIHSNVKIPLGPLKLLIGAPELHHWHHSLDRTHCNFANLSPLMDILFGTYVCPGSEPESYGVRPAQPQAYLSQLAYPFRIKKVSRRHIEGAETKSPSSESVDLSLSALE
ncbi:MAG: sterol desaturase family protein [Bdellovibrionales bacterium]|nr:sterol desaturase family protein [Bdellovibrionales bacterium]